MLRGTRPRGSIESALVGLIVWPVFATILTALQHLVVHARHVRSVVLRQLRLCVRVLVSACARARACVPMCVHACAVVRACVAVMVVCACLDGRGDAHVLRHVRPRVSEARVGDRVVEVEARDQRRRALWVAQRCAAMSDIKRGEVIRHSRGRAGTCAAPSHLCAALRVCLACASKMYESLNQSPNDWPLTIVVDEWLKK